MQQKHWLYLICGLQVVTLVLLIVVICMLSAAPQSQPQPTHPTATSPSTPEETKPTKPTESQPTAPTQTQPTDPTQPPTKPTDPTVPTQPPTKPTEPTQPPTTPTTPTQPPTEPDTFGIGMYTYEELEKLSTKVLEYGPGRGSNGSRAPYAVDAQKKYGKYAANFIAPDNGNIYLTFDCGYEYYAKDENGQKYPVTGQILDVLKEKNVKAVFFITMSYAKKQPELVQRMIDEGHIVGNHSNSHPNIPALSIDEMIDEVMSLHEYVQENFGYEMTLFRPPEGKYSEQSLAVIQNLGYKTVHWSFAYADWDTESQPAISDAMDLVTRCHHSGAIYLLHAVSTTNAEILGDVIDFFRNQGYAIELFS